MDVRRLTRQITLRRAGVVLAHAVLVSIGYLLAFVLRFDLPLSDGKVRLFLQSLPLLLGIRLAVFGWARLYQGLWRYSSMRDVAAILKATAVGSVVFMPAALGLFGYKIQRSVFVLEGLLCLILVGGARLLPRLLREASTPHGGSRRSIVVGAGDAAEALIREMQRAGEGDGLIGLVDDDRRLQGRRIHGVQVLGTLDDLPVLSVSKDVDEILVAIPSATQAERRRIVTACRASALPLKTVPSFRELLDGKARIGQLQDVDPEDLLGREAVQIDVQHIADQLTGRRVLITGAGGSIGSELCRQVAAFQPELLVLYERAESNLYFMHLELSQRHPDIKVVPVIGDILDDEKLRETFSRYSPHIVYHAAAYKHVPLMEDHPIQAITNNVIGTERVARAAIEAGVGKFVFISTDKAVRPVGVMGMTKRVAEDLLRTLSGPTSFVMVRFGNVLGSDGSVLPLFRWQLSKGGPITVTDAEASRYFMLLSEAAQLVIEAGAIGEGGEVFFLDMGDPKRIIELAEDLIRMSGLRPGDDVKVDIIGLRPGERLKEELVRGSEVLEPTKNEKILRLRSGPLDAVTFAAELESLKRAVEARDAVESIEAIEGMARERKSSN